MQGTSGQYCSAGAGENVLRSTGLYAVAGQPVTVLSPSLINSGVVVQVLFESAGSAL